MRIIENGFLLTAEEYSICMKAVEIFEKIAFKSSNLWYDSAVCAGSIEDLFSDFYQGEDEDESY